MFTCFCYFFKCPFLRPPFRHLPAALFDLRSRPLLAFRSRKARLSRQCRYLRALSFFLHLLSFPSFFCFLMSGYIPTSSSEEDPPPVGNSQPPHFSLGIHVFSGTRPMTTLLQYGASCGVGTFVMICMSFPALFSANSGAPPLALRGLGSALSNQQVGAAPAILFTQVREFGA